MVDRVLALLCRYRSLLLAAVFSAGFALGSSCHPALGASYRVGPGERYSKLSEVGPMLKEGDLVEVTGDICDSVTLNARGSKDKPIIIRGVTHLQNERVVRPHIRPISRSVRFTLKITGSWIVIEGLGFDQFKGQEYGKAAIVHAGSDLTLRNCYIHHNIRSLCADEAIAGNILVEFCEFEASGYGSLGAVVLYSLVPQATVVVRNCYFHSNTGNNLLRVGYARNVVCYNWFEDPCHFALQIGTADLPSGEAGDLVAEKLLPTHSDIVGNVFISGWGSNTYGALQIGGADDVCPGTEGDFNIAHNLFIGRRSGNIPYVPITAHGNIARVNVYNNAILDFAHDGCRVYFKDQKWDTPRTRRFVAKQGREDPLVQGANNWICDSAYNIPEGFQNTILGKAAGFFDMVDYDFRPTKSSPLAGRGLWPLPNGRIISLVPEYEPQRGIPPDLAPKRRRQVTPPSIGPFEAAEENPPFIDDSEELVAGADDVKSMRAHIQWELDFGRARRKALEYLAEGKPQEALQCAKMQFILSPLDEPTISACIESVKQMLVAVDGNDTRAKQFDRYARYGPAGRDGKLGTEDDLADPISGVALGVLARYDDSYKQYDAMLDGRAAMGDPSLSGYYWWQQRWFTLEKAMARLEGAQFDRALSLTVPVLVDAVRNPSPQVSREWALLVQNNLLDRLQEVLSATVRARTDTCAGLSETVQRYFDCAQYGTEGKDKRIGTADDVDLYLPGDAVAKGQVVRAVKERLPESAHVPLEQIESERARDDKVTAIKDAAQMTVAKLDFIGSEARHACSRTCLFGLLPSVQEVFVRVDDENVQADGVIGSLTETQRGQVLSAVEAQLALYDEYVLSAYKALESMDTGEGTLEWARAYLTAYFAGTHKGGSYAPALVRIAHGVTGDRAPSFLVSDALTKACAPMKALEVFDALEGSGCAPDRDGREKLAAILDTGIYEFMLKVDVTVDSLPQGGQAYWYEQARLICDAYLSRFPEGRHRPNIELAKAICQYRTGDYRGAAITAESVSSRCRQPFLASNAALVRCLAMLDAGQRDAAIAELERTLKTWPSSSAVPRILYVAGHAYREGLAYKKAIECYQKLVDFFPNDPLTDKARKALDVLKKRSIAPRA